MTLPSGWVLKTRDGITYCYYDAAQDINKHWTANYQSVFDEYTYFVNSDGDAYGKDRWDLEGELTRNLKERAAFYHELLKLKKAPYPGDTQYNIRHEWVMPPDQE